MTDTAAALDRLRRRDAFAAAVIARRHAADVQAEQRYPLSPGAQPVAPRETPMVRRVRAETQPSSFDRVQPAPAPATIQRLNVPAQGRSAAMDSVARARWSESRYYASDRAALAQIAFRLAHMSESERLLRRAEYRDERSLLAQSGFSQAHRVMVSDDTWRVRQTVDADGHLRRVGSATWCVGHAPGVPASQGQTVGVRHVDSDGYGVVSIDVYRAEPTEEDLARQAVARERRRQEREAELANRPVEYAVIPVGLTTEVARWAAQSGETAAQYD